MKWLKRLLTSRRQLLEETTQLRMRIADLEQQRDFAIAEGRRKELGALHALRVFQRLQPWSASILAALEAGGVLAADHPVQTACGLTLTVGDLRAVRDAVPDEAMHVLPGQLLTAVQKLVDLHDGRIANVAEVRTLASRAMTKALVLGVQPTGLRS